MTTTTNELLANLEAAETYSDYMAAWVLVERRMNRSPYFEAERIIKEMRRISAERSPIVNASYGKGRIYSLEECAAYQAARKPANLLDATRRAEHIAQATSFVLTALSSNRPVVREDVHPVAAE